MSKKSMIGRFLCTTVLSGAMVGGFSAPALAQDEAASDDRILVTGSRIAKRDATADSPILTVDQDAFTNSGYVTVEHYLNTLPQVVPGLSSQSNNPSSNGRAFINLRGLGAGRNLVLIDGRRAMGQASGGTIVDVNTIPAALIERVEVITGGASAVYGPDAVAGVVNFIMKKSFDGFALDGQYRITEEGDGREYNIDATFGSDFMDGRGSSVFNVSYFNRSDLYKDAREFSAQASSSTGTFPGGNLLPGVNAPSQAAVDAIFGPGVCNANGGGSGFGFNPDGSLFCTGVGGNPLRNVVGYTGPQDHIATAFYPDFFSYNFEPDNILVLPLERLSFYAAVELDLESWFKPYAKAIFTNYNALQELAPTPAGGFTVPVTNPFLSQQAKDLLASRAAPLTPISHSKRFNGLGGRTGYNSHNVWQVVAGTQGDLFASWGYDLYISYGQSQNTEIQGGNVRVPQYQAVLDDPATAGGGVCATWNPFGLDPMPQACQDFVGLKAKNSTFVEQVVVEGTVNGELFQLPAGAVALALGASYRWIDFAFEPDSGLQPGLVAGFNGQLPIFGYTDFTDLFGEIAIPILADMPFVKMLQITGGYRTTDTSSSGVTDSWKVTGDWQVNDYLRFRGGYQHAVRSPNVAELFSPQVPNFPNIGVANDPCNTSGAITTHPQMGRAGPNGAAVQALCAAQAAIAGGAGFQQTFGQVQALSGGNPNLNPEEADTWTVGVVIQSPFESPWLQRASLSVDYWNISMENVIAAVGALTILQRCYNRDGANPTYSINNPWCQLFQRDPADGRVIDLLQLSQNQAFSKDSGIDVAFNWGFDLDLLGLGASSGALDFNFVGTWIQQAKSQTTAVDPVFDFVGAIGVGGAGASTPEFKFTINTTYSRDNFALQATTRYIDGMIHANVVTGGSPVTNTGTPSTWYVDLMARYNLTDNISLRAGINNLLDQDPRLYNPNVQANTDPSLYDILGRRYFFGVNVRM